ncbi:hypothetical protein RBH26_00115 [Natronolimnohabitans sp. A-GB9]|uniref:DUF7344 domain-containing protein n=1 Tax=Natronolimnohabitans sp. A-GB9 TaxID=3069757 RepID=UPI0027B4181B|nr:hypothetical protein [Natronolimnohabitans sp. A-GB9]MDQ2048881.1 hypothetical protein [Natronolimnohabitans sp. A-GB9]
MSNPDVSDRSAASRDDLFDVLATRDRRELLRIVRNQTPAGIGKADLALELAAVIDDKPAAAVTEDDRRRVLVDCHHRVLPALFEAGLLTETDDDRVVTTDHWAFDDDELMAVVDGRSDTSETDLDALFEGLSDSRRRTVLTVLANESEPITTESLARAVTACEDGVTERNVGEDRILEVRTALVHVHLPLLDDAGLVGYDAETGSVSVVDHPLLCVEWLEDEADADVDDDRFVPSDDDSVSGASSDESDAEARERLQGRVIVSPTAQSRRPVAEDD